MEEKRNHITIKISENKENINIHRDYSLNNQDDRLGEVYDYFFALNPKGQVHIRHNNEKNEIINIQGIVTIY